MDSDQLKFIVAPLLTIQKPPSANLQGLSIVFVWLYGPVVLVKSCHCGKIQSAKYTVTGGVTIDIVLNATGSQTSDATYCTPTLIHLFDKRSCKSCSASCAMTDATEILPVPKTEQLLSSRGLTKTRPWGSSVDSMILGASGLS